MPRGRERLVCGDDSSSWATQEKTMFNSSPSTKSDSLDKEENNRSELEAFLC